MMCNRRGERFAQQLAQKLYPTVHPKASFWREARALDGESLFVRAFSEVTDAE
jgi:hypothetical protein